MLLVLVDCGAGKQRHRDQGSLLSMKAISSSCDHVSRLVTSDCKLMKHIHRWWGHSIIQRCRHAESRVLQQTDHRSLTPKRITRLRLHSYNRPLIGSFTLLVLSYRRQDRIRFIWNFGSWVRRCWLHKSVINTFKRRRGFRYHMPIADVMPESKAPQTPTCSTSICEYLYIISLIYLVTSIGMFERDSWNYSVIGYAGMISLSPISGQARGRVIVHLPPE